MSASEQTLTTDSDNALEQVKRLMVHCGNFSKHHHLAPTQPSPSPKSV